MENQAIEQTQFSDIIEKIAGCAISVTGKEMVQSLKPNSNIKDVSRLLDETGEIVGLLNKGKSIPSLSNEAIDEVFTKIDDGYVLDPKELIMVADYLNNVESIKSFFEVYKNETPIVSGYAAKIEVFYDIEDTIRYSIKNSKVSSDASKQLKKVRQSIEKHNSDIKNKLSKFLSSSANKNKIQEFMIVERDGVSVIPIKSSFKNQVKGRIVDESSKGSTVFMQLDITSESSQKLSIAQAEEISIVYQILAELTDKIADKIEILKRNNEVIYGIEVIMAKAKFSNIISGNRVNVTEDGVIKLINAKHPLLGNDAVPLSIEIGGKQKGLVITGSNSGGKTVVLKTVGLLSLMTMIGVFIPADSNSTMSIFDHVLVDIGDYQDFENALSTFSGHMNNMKKILEIADSNSLVLVDEIGSGTEPSEGAAIAIAMLEHLVNQGALVIASTHYGEIKEFVVLDSNFSTAAMAFNVETLMPLYKLLMNEVGESNGFWLAKRMKINDSVLERAIVHRDNFRK